MPSTRRFLVPLLVLSLLAACAPSQTASPVPTGAFPTAAKTESSPAASPTAFTGATGAVSEPSPTPAEAPVLSKPRYTLTVNLDYTQRTAEISEEIVYPNRTGEALTELLLDVEPVDYANTFSLTGAAWEDGAAISGLTWEEPWLHVPLRQSLEPGQSIQFSLAYTLDIPTPVVSEDIRPIPFGATDRQINLVDWYPYIPPYQPGVGWQVHPAGYYGEHMAFEMADFDVNLHLTDGRTDLAVAASAAAAVDGEWRRYHLETARNFALSISHLYQVTEQQVGNITVYGYAFGTDAVAGTRALQTTAEALAFYQEVASPYPHTTLSVVEADFLDGMEYDGLYFLSYGFYNLYSGTTGEYLVAIAAHETAHQWWYALVGNDQALEPWLDEALATYAERLYFEHYYPAALDWWWAYRVNYYEPRGWVDTTIYNDAGSLQPYRDYRDAVYLNGAVFLEELRQTIGDEAFFAFLRDYTVEFSGKIATTGDFFNTLASHTSADLSALTSTYFVSR